MSKHSISIGERRCNRYGTWYTIIDYKNWDNVTIKLDNGYIMQVGKDSIVYNTLGTPFDKKVYGVGYIGVGDYVVGDGRYENGGSRQHRCYRIWSGMLCRCYNDKYQNKKPTYKGCYVCDEWLCYQNFAKWYYDNYYEINGTMTMLDKDIIKKNNKCYCPQYCCFVPNEINVMFTSCKTVRGQYPVGITYKGGKYCARVSNYILGNKERITVGYYDNMDDAFMAYKTAKEQIIKKVADAYVDLIPNKLYRALCDYVVEITD